MPFHDACALDDVPEDGGLGVEVNEEFVAVFRLPGGGVAAIEDACPHAGAPLSDGHLEPGGCSGEDPDTGGTVVCPLHAWRFDVTTGGWCDGPAGKIKVAVYPVKVEDGRVWVDVPD